MHQARTPITDQLVASLSKPLAEKIAVLSTTAKLSADATPDAIVAGIRALGVDPTTHVPRSTFDELSTRLATLTAETRTKLIADATAAGKLTPGMKTWAESLDHAQLSAYLATAPIIVAPPGGGGGGGGGTGALTVATMSVEQKREADRFGVSHETYVATLNESAAT